MCKNNTIYINCHVAIDNHRVPENGCKGCTSDKGCESCAPKPSAMRLYADNMAASLCKIHNLLHQAVFALNHPEEVDYVEDVPSLIAGLYQEYLCIGAIRHKIKDDELSDVEQSVVKEVVDVHNIVEDVLDDLMAQFAEHSSFSDTPDNPPDNSPEDLPVECVEFCLGTEEDPEEDGCVARLRFGGNVPPDVCTDIAKLVSDVIRGSLQQLKERASDGASSKEN